MSFVTANSIPLSAGVRAPVLLLALACAIQVAETQAPSPRAAQSTATGQYRIAGTVTNTLTGEPVRRASVAVLDEKDSHLIESVRSDNEGQFVLAGLPAAKYQLTASKRGYRTAFYDEHEDYSTAIVTGADQDTGGIRFRLTPAAVLRGQVTGDGGDPVEGARILLFRKPRKPKLGERIAHADSATTDDTGMYEFSDLAAGDYLVAVTAEPWYSLHRPVRSSGPTASEDAASSLDVSYPVTYFDSTTDETSATPIPLAAGQTEQVNIGLHAVPSLHLFVQPSRHRDGSVARPELRQLVFGMDISSENMGPFDLSANAEAEFSGVAPGRYELAQGDPQRTVDIDATSDQQFDPSLGTPTVEISGALKSAAGAALEHEATVVLQALDPDSHTEAMPTNAAGGSFRYASVQPGKWAVSAYSAGRRLAVTAIMVGDRTHGGNVLNVGDRPLKILLTVAAGDMRVEGFARKAGKGIAGTMVILVPRDLNAIQELARRDQSDSDGSFSLRDAAPGQYTVVAIQDGWDLDWSRPDVIRRFLPRGTPVTVMDSSTKIQTLAGAVAVQSQ
ncbi:MAG TPA: carboxypeptidase-like regulatory domain-containing protein [Terracidiphilus sp.]|nr:carboxypeptidase-like regulatory domain-containing protein [Terracidiphilus sp.]